MSREIRGDYFDKARGVSAAGLLAAAAAAVLGSLLDWVEITPPPILPESQAQGAEPFTGIEATDGWWVIGFAGALILMAIMLTVRRRSHYGWLAFLISITIGIIGISRYREIGNPTSSFSRRMDIVGDADVAIGIQLVAAAAFIGIVASLIGVAATPRPSPE